MANLLVPAVSIQTERPAAPNKRTRRSFALPLARIPAIGGRLPQQAAVIPICGTRRARDTLPQKIMSVNRLPLTRPAVLAAAAAGHAHLPGERSRAKDASNRSLPTGTPRCRPAKIADISPASPRDGGQAGGQAGEVGRTATDVRMMSQPTFLAKVCHCLPQAVAGQWSRHTLLAASSGTLSTARLVVRDAIHATPSKSTR